MLRAQCGHPRIGCPVLRWSSARGSWAWAKAARRCSQSWARGSVWFEGGLYGSDESAAGTASEPDFGCARCRLSVRQCPQQSGQRRRVRDSATKDVGKHDRDGVATAWPTVAVRAKEPASPKDMLGVLGVVAANEPVAYECQDKGRGFSNPTSPEEGQLWLAEDEVLAQIELKAIGEVRRWPKEAMEEIEAALRTWQGALDNASRALATLEDAVGVTRKWW